MGKAGRKIFTGKNIDSVIERILEERRLAEDALKYTTNVLARIRMLKQLAICNALLANGFDKNVLMTEALKEVLDQESRYKLDNDSVDPFWRWVGTRSGRWRRKS